MAKELQVGERLPQFHVVDQGGYEVQADDLIGIPLVLYFYPKDGTPGCTKEAQAFQESIFHFDANQVLVIGVSPDSVESHKKFIEANKLSFSLLSDPKKTMCKKFGVIKEGKVVRTTFVVNARGVIQWREQPVKLEGHVDRVLHAIKTQCADELSKYTSFQKDYPDFFKKEAPAVTAEEKALKRKMMKDYGISEKD